MESQNNMTISNHMYILRVNALDTRRLYEDAERGNLLQYDAHSQIYGESMSFESVLSMPWDNKTHLVGV